MMGEIKPGSATQLSSATKLHFQRYERPWCFFLFLLAAYWLYGANLFRGETIAPMDLLLSYAGFSEDTTPLLLKNVEKADIIDGMYPVWRFTAHELRAGRWPLWNPNLAGGEPN